MEDHPSPGDLEHAHVFRHQEFDEYIGGDEEEGGAEHQQDAARVGAPGVTGARAGGIVDHLDRLGGTAQVAPDRPAGRRVSRRQI